MHMTVRQRLLVTLLLACNAVHARDTSILDATPPDRYDTLRRNCSTAGADDWKRCQDAVTQPGDSSDRACNEALDRQRRMCMLQVMERQNRDIQGPASPSTP